MHSLDQGAFEDIFVWSFNGLSFIIIDPKAFTEEVLPSLFKTAKFESFKRKLKRWGFAMRRGAGRHGVVAPSTLWVCHPYFQRGNFELCKKILCVSKGGAGAVLNTNTSNIAPCTASTTIASSCCSSCSPASSSCISPRPKASTATDSSSTNASSLVMLSNGGGGLNTTTSSPVKRTRSTTNNRSLSVAANVTSTSHDDGRSLPYSWPPLFFKDEPLPSPRTNHTRRHRQDQHCCCCCYGPIHHDRSASSPPVPVPRPPVINEKEEFCPFSTCNVEADHTTIPFSSLAVHSGGFRGSYLQSLS